LNYFHLDGSIEKREVIVRSFDPIQKKMRVYFEGTTKEFFTTRSNLQMDFESEKEASERQKTVRQFRRDVQNRINIEKAILSEMANVYTYVKLPSSIR
jgi:hypothetical protein